MSVVVLVAVCALVLTRVAAVVWRHWAEQRRQGLDQRALERRLSGHRVQWLSLRFGAQLYRELSLQSHYCGFASLWTSAPSLGLEYRMPFVDTGEEDGEDKPVLVLIHGSPGGIRDWTHFVARFGRHFRLLVPQLPDFRFSRQNDCFRHSTPERAAVVAAFLDALGVRRVRALVCHSGGNAIALSLINSIECSALVMIAPPGFQWLSTRQLRQTRRLVRAVTDRWRRRLFLLLFPDWLLIAFGISRSLLRNTTRDQMFEMAAVAALSAFETVFEKQYEALVAKRTPVLFVFGQKDALFAEWKFRRTLRWIRAEDETEWWEVDAEGRVTHRPQTPPTRRVVRFSSGGHFLHVKFADVFHDVCNEFVSNVAPNVVTTVTSPTE